MNIILGSILINVIELIIILFIILYKKNKNQQIYIEQQQKRLNEIDLIIRQGMHRIQELDEQNTFRSDDQLGVFWTELTNIYKILQ